MSAEHPAYWLVYVPARTELGATEVAAIAPEELRAQQFCRDAQWLLAAADGYHVHHPHDRVVFTGAVTRWLHTQGVGWGDVAVDVGGALRDLDEHASRLVIEASELTMAVAASPTHVIEVLHPSGRVEHAERINERVRDELRQELERDWPPHIRSVTARRSAADLVEARAHR
jgi:hypothetical protein